MSGQRKYQKLLTVRMNRVRPQADSGGQLLQSYQAVFATVQDILSNTVLLVLVSEEFRIP